MVDFLLTLILLGLASYYQKSNQRTTSYELAAGVPRVWKSEPPEVCPFDPSQKIKGIAFTGRYVIKPGVEL